MIKIFFFFLSQRYSPHPPELILLFLGGGGRRGWSERNRPAVKSNRKWRAACDKVGDAGGEKGRVLPLSKRSPALYARNNTACELVRAWRRNGTEPVAASCTTPREIGFFFRVARLSLRPMRFSCSSTRLQSGYSQGSRPPTIRPTLFIISRPSSRDEEDNGRVMGRHPCSWIRVWPLVMFTAV